MFAITQPLPTDNLKKSFLEKTKKWNTQQHLKNEYFEQMKKKRFRIYVHFTHVYHKRKSIDVWFLRYEVWQAEFYFGSYFLLSLFLGLFSMPWDLPHKIFCLFKLFKLQVYSLYIHKILKKMLIWAEFKFMNYQLNDNGTFSPKKDNC